LIKSTNTANTSFLLTSDNASNLLKLIGPSNSSVATVNTTQSSGGKKHTRDNSSGGS